MADLGSASKTLTLGGVSIQGKFAPAPSPQVLSISVKQFAVPKVPIELYYWDYNTLIWTPVPT